MNPKILFAILFCLLLPHAFAQSYANEIPAAGGWMDGVTISPHNSNIVLAGGDVFGAAISTDGGYNWQPCYGFRMAEIESFTFHPANPNIVLAATSGGIYRSTDSGFNFSPVRSGDLPAFHIPNGSRYFSAPVAYVAADPSNPGTFYAGLGNHRNNSNYSGTTWTYAPADMGDIFKSTDSGVTWLKIFDGGTDKSCSSNVLHMAVDPFNATIVFKTVDCAGVYRSNDSGVTWAKKISGINESNFNNIVADPNNVGVYYLTTGKYGEIYKTTNRGDSWTLVSDSSHRASGSVLNSSHLGPEPIVACNNAGSTVLYAGSSFHGQGIWKSTDNGNIWHQLYYLDEPSTKSPNFPLLPYTNDWGLKCRHHSLSVDSQNCDKVIAGAGAGLFLTNNAGLTWESAGGHTSNGGQSWTGVGFSGVCIDNTEFDPNDPNHFITMGGDEGFWQTWDNGATWERSTNGIEINGPPYVNFSDGAISHLNSQKMFVTGAESGEYVDGGELYYTTNGGDSWSKRSTALGFTSIEILAYPSSDATLCAARAGRILRSTDSGANFSERTSNISAVQISQDPANPDVVYASTQDGDIYKSVDGCLNWSQIGSAPVTLLWGAPFSRVAIDPTNSNNIYFAGTQGFYKYNGSTWGKVLDATYGIAMDVGLDGAVYAVERGGPHRDLYPDTAGIWKSTDAGSTWTNLINENNAPNLRFYDISVNPLTGQVFAGMACGGIIRLDGGQPPTSTFYVGKTSCSDSGEGSLSQPWCTIGHALSVLNAGETVLIRAGTYNESELVPTNSGSVGNPITIKNYSGEQVILKGDWQPGAQTTTDGFEFSNKSYITIDGLEISNFRRCIYLASNNDNVTLKNLNVHHCLVGISARDGSDFLTVENTKTHHISDPADTENGHAGVECKNSGNLTISKVESYLNDDSSVSGDGIYLEYCDNATLTDINAHDNSDAGFDLTGNNMVLDKIYVYNNTAPGIKLWRRSGDSYAPKNYTITNALLINNSEAGIKLSEGPNLILSSTTVFGNTEEGIWIKPNSHGDTATVTIRNTIFANNSTGIRFEATGNSITASHLIFFGNSTHHNLSPAPTSSIFNQNPLFINSSQNNFHLQTSSPAKDSGTSSYAPNHDFDNSPRPMDSGYDIGAFEASGSVPNCSEGLITTLCICGGVEHSTGYCCSNVWQSSACSECVDMPALMGFIAQWKAGTLEMAILMQKINAWKTQTGC